MSDSTKRRSTRFLSDPPVSVFVNGNIPALAFSEAAKGCGLVMHAKYAPRQGDTVGVAIGHLAPVEGVVRWVNSLDEDIVKIGIEYLE